MKSSVCKPLVLLVHLSLCAFLMSCGAGPYIPSAQISATSVAGTQNPLVAAYTMTTILQCAGQVRVEFGPDTSYGRTTAWYPVSGTVQTTTVLVAGMRPSTTYHMRALTQCADSTNPMASGDLTFASGPLPAIAFPTLAVARPSPSTSSPENPGIELVDIVNPGTPALFTDRDANPIWYYDVGPANFPFVFKLLPSGNILVNIAGPTDSLIREIDLSGKTIREMDTTTLGNKMQAAGFDFSPGNFHHDFLALDNGHLIVLTNFVRNYDNLPGYPGTTGVIGDGIVDLDENWNPVWAWNGFDHLDVNRHLNGMPDWTHGNALVYSANDGNLMFSMRHQSWIIKIDYNNGAGSGNILWKLGYQGDFSLTDNDVPTSDPSLWFSFQHFPSIVSQSGSQTTLAIWDNGDFRPLDTLGNTCTFVPGSPQFCYSRGTIIQVDENSKIANLLWADPLPYFGFWGGSINQLANGNVEFDLNAPLLGPAPHVGSRIEELIPASPSQVVWQMDALGVNAYRGYRVPSLYPGVNWQY